MRYGHGIIYTNGLNLALSLPRLLQEQYNQPLSSEKNN
jgi:hypothetical protein